MRDKLIELLEKKYDHYCDQCGVNKDTHYIENLADYLIANGVTVQQWIPVSERLPDTIPNSAGTAYSDAVNALTSERKVITAIYDGKDFIGDAEFWEAEDEEITHWTPVLLPMPELPKEGEA